MNSRLFGAKPCGCCKSDDEPPAVSDDLGAAFGRVAAASPAAAVAFLPDLSEVRDSTEDEELPLLGRD